MYLFNSGMDTPENHILNILMGIRLPLLYVCILKPNFAILWLVLVSHLLIGMYLMLWKLKVSVLTASNS